MTNQEVTEEVNEDTNNEKYEEVITEEGEEGVVETSFLGTEKHQPDLDAVKAGLGIEEEDDVKFAAVSNDAELRGTEADKIMADEDDVYIMPKPEDVEVYNPEGVSTELFGERGPKVNIKQGDAVLDTQGLKRLQSDSTGMTIAGYNISTGKSKSNNSSVQPEHVHKIFKDKPINNVGQGKFKS